jgi:hypothetical protein
METAIRRLLRERVAEFCPQFGLRVLTLQARYGASEKVGLVTG